MHPGRNLKYFLFIFFLLHFTPVFSIKKIRIGFSQCTTADKWRQSQIRLMEIELAFFPDMELSVKDANDNSETQIRQIEDFLKEGIDLLIVSPNESEPIRPIVERVFKSGIPVIVIDRRVNTQFYTAYIGGNNYRIGQEAGAYAARLLNGKGKILELSGLKGSSPAIERHNGLVDFLKNYPDIQIVKSVSGEWNWDEAREVMQQIAGSTLEFDLVFAHNDVMAREAFNVLQERGTRNGKFILGVDGLAGDDAGIQYVIDKKLNATFLYPTGGESAIQIANKIFTRQAFEKENILPTLVIDSTNAQILKVQTSQVELLHQKIEKQKSILDIQISKNQTQRLILIFLISLLVLIAALVILTFKAFRNKKIANEKLEAKNHKIKKQNIAILEQRDKLVEVSQQLEEATQAKLRFFTNISHEFRTPLTLIKGPLENLMQSEQFTAEQQNKFKLMHRNTIRLLRLVNQ
ncbi:MAG: substrate-binding domain-containing protein, partial [Bacteroidota bacterium]|nr:substrate-binding domain-containing protein [Bacteroidota bacterium]